MEAYNAVPEPAAPAPLSARARAVVAIISQHAGGLSIRKGDLAPLAGALGITAKEARDLLFSLAEGGHVRLAGVDTMLVATLAPKGVAGK